MSIESQMDRLVQYRHYNLPDIQWSTVSYPEGNPEGFFIDRGVSAYEGSKLAKRPAGAVMLSQLQKGDHVLVWSIDRMFRNVGDYGTTIDMFKKRGILVHFVKDGIDLATASGQLKADILAVMAQHWSRMIGFRTREAHRISKLRKGLCPPKPDLKPAPSPSHKVASYLESQAVDSAIALTSNKKMRREVQVAKRVWGYIRVSSTGQVESGLGLESQRESVERSMQGLVEQGAESIEVVVDEAESSFKVPFADRPGGKRILEEAQAGDVVVVYRFDRIFRSLTDSIRQVSEFRRRGIVLRLVEEGIQTNDSTGDWYWSLLGTFAELESQLKSERCSEALQKRKRLGLRHAKRLMIYRHLNINGQKRWRLDVSLLVRLRISHIMRLEHGFNVPDSCHIANAIATDYGQKWVSHVFHNKKGQRDRTATPARHTITLKHWNQITESIGGYAARRIEEKARKKLAAGISQEAFTLCKRAGVLVERLRRAIALRTDSVNGTTSLPLADADVSLPGVEDL